MMPPPITSSRFGTPPSSSAPVESITRGSSGMNGSFTGSDPAAITHWSKLTVFAPSAPSTRIAFGPVKVPTPETTVTLRAFARPVRPPVSFLTTLSFQPRSPSMSISGFAYLTPKWPISSASEITLAACSSALDGMQPDVQADAAEGRVALDQHHLQPEIRRPESRGVAARPGPEHDELGMDVAGRRSAGPRGRRRLGRLGCRSGRSAFGLQRQDDRAFGDLVARLHLHRDDLAGGGRRHLHRRLVRLELEQRVFLRHRVAGLHEDRDDRHVLEIPDVGDLDLDLRHQSSPGSEQQVARVAQQGRERGDETRPERPVDRPVVE